MQVFLWHDGDLRIPCLMDECKGEYIAGYNSAAAEAFIEAGYAWLNEMAFKIDVCEDRSCITCRTTDLITEIEGFKETHPERSALPDPLAESARIKKLEIQVAQMELTLRNLINVSCNQYGEHVVGVLLNSLDKDDD